MAKDDVIRQFWAGIFFVAGVLLVAGVIYYIGFRKGFTEPRFTVSVYFDKVGGLSLDAPVRLSGVTVGSVSDISFLEQPVMDRGLEVKLAIYSKFARQVRSCTKVSILTEGVLGAKYVEMGRDPGEPPLDLDLPLLGEPTLDVSDMAAILQDTANSFNEATKGINSMVVDVTQISGKTKRLLNRVEQRVIDGTLFRIF